MKNLFLLLMAFSLFGTLHGQTTKGTWIIGLHNFSPVPLSSGGTVLNLFPQTNSLGISFGSSKEKLDGEIQDGKENNTVFGLSLNSHFFVADQFSVGLVGNLSSASSTYKSDNYEDSKSSATILLLGPEVRYYFDTGTKTKIWLKSGASFGSVSSKYDGESDDPVSLSQFGGGGGLSIFPVQTISIDFGLGYNVLTATMKDTFYGDQKSINSALVLDIGFGLFFGGGMKKSSPLPE